MVGAFAQASGKLAAPEAVIAMFGGTSVVELAREVQHELRATIFTIRPPVAIELASRPHRDCHLIGGFEKAALETSGPDAVDALRAVQPDLDSARGLM